MNANRRTVLAIVAIVAGIAAVGLWWYGQRTPTSETANAPSIPAEQGHPTSTPPTANASSTQARLTRPRASSSSSHPVNATSTGIVANSSNAQTGSTSGGSGSNASAPSPIPASTGTVCNASLLGSDGLDSSRVISRSACDLVNSLYASGRAAGNAGDQYENRDGLHVNMCEDWSPNPTCPTDHELFPQESWIFSGSIGRRTDVHPGVTVGQASWAGLTAEPFKYSIQHSLYQSQSGADELYAQYTHNNLFVYPSLDDERFAGDPGDLAVLADPAALDRRSMNIANAPYSIASSQISKAGTPSYRIHNASGSDLPFVKLATLALASFRPDVKAALEKGPAVDGDRLSFLMPTLEMALRHAHRTIGSESDYLGSQIVHRSMSMAHYLANGAPQPQYGSEKLVRIVNGLSVADIPPLVRLSVVSQTFADGERLFDTPGAIARDVAADAGTRTITVSAAGTLGLDGSTGGNDYAWRVVGGDASHASIAVDPSDPSKATITFTPTSAGDRLDVGVFARQPGQPYYSVPGIVSMHVH